MDLAGLKKEKSPVHRLLTGKNMISEIEIIGDQFEPVKLKEAPTKELAFLKFLPGNIIKLFSSIRNPLPKFTTEKCTLCGNCVISCPAKILKIDQKKIKMTDKANCIKCYCCHELCPNKAVKI